MTEGKKQDDSIRGGGPEHPGKRKAIRRMLTGGGILSVGAMGAKWSKPAMNSVLLPAHGQSTGTPAPTVAPTNAPTPAPTPAPTAE